MQNSILAAVLMLLLTFLAACSGGASATQTQPSSGASGPTTVVPARITLSSVPMILDPSRVPPEPDAAVNNATVAGVDSNNNGIRDDVERWIVQTYPTSAKLRAVAAQGANVLQNAMKTQGKEEALAAETKVSRYISCLIAVVDNGSQEVMRHRALKKQLINTPDRFAAFDAYDSHLSGQVFFSKKDKSKEANCDVNIDSLPN